MKNILISASVILVASGFAGCTSNETHSVAISGSPIGPKEGRATSHHALFGIISTGDNAIRTAVRNGGITKPTTVEDSGDQYTVFWGALYRERTTIVTGE